MPDENDDEEFDDVIIDVNTNPDDLREGQRLRERLVNHLSPQLLKKENIKLYFVQTRY
jgi:glycosyltransferase involved in cell wall biosynthesis